MDIDNAKKIVDLLKEEKIRIVIGLDRFTGQNILIC